jgi:hypothetical protein
MKAAHDRFFDDASLDHPLRNSNWRGCVLDRDQFTNVRLPEVLWQALICAVSPAEVQVCGYIAGIERCQAVSSSWAEFSSFMLGRQNYSPEYLVFDASNRWAIFADADVTTAAMDSDLAKVVDAHLASRDTSLLKLTLDNFPMEEIQSSGGIYIRSVLGNSFLNP